MGLNTEQLLSIIAFCTMILAAETLGRTVGFIAKWILEK